MANSGKQSPLGINVLGSLLSGTGFNIDPIAASFMGASKTNSVYSFGKIVNDTVLRLLTWSINDGYLRGPGNGNATLSDATYNNLISIGSSSIGALGNSKPASYSAIDPSGKWTSAGTPATTGYSISGNTDQGQAASWLPYDTTNPNKSVTQWGYLRLHALQAWNEYNWNGASPSQADASYKDFCGSFTTANSFIKSTNKAIHAAHHANTFQKGAYSNMNDLTSADLTGVSLASSAFGTDLENLGKVINLSRIDAFGLPSVLLATIGKNSAITQDLSFLLLASGLSSSEINALTSGTLQRPSVDQERKIYSAFLLITGPNLAAILAPLQCKTTGFTTLADLLDVKKLFPNSYASLTVPKYNGVVGLPTNSKTYYPLYVSTGINSALQTDEMKEYVGEQIPSGPPPIVDSSRQPDNYLTPKKGFGSYLAGILPADQATAAGALQFSLRQINNINKVDPKKFAKVAKSIETMSDLTLVAGTDKPSAQDAIDACRNKLALGSGPYGSYTMSDFFGCMSGLPYPWKLLYDRINQLQNTKLKNIYQQMFLAVTWEQAQVTVQYTTNPGPTYTVTGFTITNPGGGYGRGSAPAPTITVSDGSTATVVIGTDDTNAGSNGTGQYGRVINVILNTPAAPTSNIPTATIQAPPIDTLPVATDGSISTSGVNYPNGTVGWPSPMNSVTQSYIDQANTTISDIAAAKPDIAKHLNAYWTSLGSQLTIEQRSRFTGIPAANLTSHDDTLYSYPTSLITFVDSIPSFAQETAPHMASQLLEGIVDMNSLAGQSLVGMMRQERNQIRLHHAGIPMSNNIPDTLSDMDQKTLTTNGTLEAAGYNNDINGYTNPAWSSVELNGEVIAPKPSGIYTPTTRALVGTYTPTSSTQPGDITPLLEGRPNATVSTNVPSGPSPETESPVNAVVIIQPPSQLDPANVPLNLDSAYTNSTLLPASPSVDAAIDKVTECNCDCWIQ